MHESSLSTTFLNPKTKVWNRRKARKILLFLLPICDGMLGGSDRWLIYLHFHLRLLLLLGLLKVSFGVGIDTVELDSVAMFAFALQDRILLCFWRWFLFWRRRNLWIWSICVFLKTPIEAQIFIGCIILAIVLKCVFIRITIDSIVIFCVLLRAFG